MDFNFKKRGHSPETHKLRTERKRILKPQKKTEGYRSTDCPNMARNKWKNSTRIYNRFFNYCEAIGTRENQQENQQNNNESWLNSSDGEN